MKRESRRFSGWECQKRLTPSLVLAAIVLLASWLATAGGGDLAGEWAPVALILAALALIASVAGVLHGAGSWWGNAALGLFAAYTLWPLASLLWSPDPGDAWLGAGQTLLYLLAFWLSLSLILLGASRRWVLAVSVIGPAVVAAFTLLALVPRIDDLFENESGRLLGTVVYYNGEAAFLLVPFWAAVYLGGSSRVNSILRGLILAGTVLEVDLAVLTQSRGAMVAMAISLPVFFLISGQRLRGLFALAPIVLALLVTFPGLNGIYLAFQNGESAQQAILGVLPSVWLAAAGAGLYGFLWGLIDRRWEITSSATRLIGGVALAVVIVVLIFGSAALSERVGNPVSWGEQKWEAFKNDDTTGKDKSRYLAASGSGRYTLWQVAWEDFTAHPLLGIGTYNYEPTYYQLRGKDLGYVRQPHILPLEVLSERGVIGGVLFFGFLATCLSAGLWKRFSHLGSEGKAQVGAMTAAVAYWFVHSSAEWFWQLPAVTLLAIVYLAMLVGPWGETEAAPLRWPLRAVGAGVAVLAVAVFTPLYAADHYLAQRYAATDPQEALAAVETAQEVNPVDPWLPLHEAELAALIGNRSRAEKAFDEAVRLNPEHYVPYLLQGKFYEQVGEPEQALQSYRQALALNPLDKDLNQKVDEFATKVEG